MNQYIQEKLCQVTMVGIILFTIILAVCFTPMLIKWWRNRRIKPLMPDEYSVENNDCQDMPDLTADPEPDKVNNQNTPQSSICQMNDYCRRFLTPYRPMARQGIYIDRELHAKVTAIMGIVGLSHKMTVGNYVDNVLAQHFEQYGEDVKSLCSKGLNQIL